MTDSPAVLSVNASTDDAFNGHFDGASRPGALKQLGPGVYTSANSPYVTGEGSIAVRGMGLVLFVN